MTSSDQKRMEKVRNFASVAIQTQSILRETEKDVGLELNICEISRYVNLDFNFKCRLKRAGLNCFMLSVKNQMKRV